MDPIYRLTRDSMDVAFLTVLLLSSPARSEVIYVKADATGNNDGTTWEHAFPDLQDALATAVEGDQIWVAQGTYSPAPPSGDRAATFNLISGVGLYGGFAGFEEDLEQRDPELNVTVLSGDLNGDDGENFENNGENSYHVVTGDGTDASAVLDGFTVTAGNADGSESDTSRGGGMHNDGASLTIRDCVFFRNSSQEDGGGMVNLLSDPTVINCAFRENVAGHDGGGVYGNASNPELTDCLFMNNHADDDGGGMRNISGSASVINCRFIGNSAAEDGGGMVNSFTDSLLVNVLFSGNITGINGGGLRNSSSSPTLINCTFSANIAKGMAGGMYSTVLSFPIVTNGVFWGNSDASGVGEAAQLAGAFPTVSFTCIQGLDTLAGNGNVGDDPLFVDANGPDGTPGTEDDNLRLQPLSPVIDLGDSAAVPKDITTDLDGNDRIVDGTSDGQAAVDMGAYEYPPACDGDANEDGTIDPLDAGFVLARLGCAVGTGDSDCDAADQNFDGVVDPLDVGYVLARFGECP